MARVFAVVLLCFVFGVLDAVITPEMINAHAAQLAKFSQEIRSLFPPAIRSMTKASCRMISECCPSARADVLSFALSGDRQGLATKCFGPRNAPDYRAKVGACEPAKLAKKMGENYVNHSGHIVKIIHAIVIQLPYLYSQKLNFF